MNGHTSRLKYIYEILPTEIVQALNRISSENIDSIDEIRMRSMKPVSLTIKGKNYFLLKNGKISDKPDNSIKVTPIQIEQVYLKSFGNSLHSYPKEIIQGSVTIAGGNRVGFCGSAVCDSRKNYAVENVKNISSVNIRIAREVYDCSRDFYDSYLKDKPESILIAGTPASGKTTFLRDLTRQLGNNHRISLIDEKGEFSAANGNQYENDVGLLTDIFNGYNKYEGIMTAVKSMNPEYIVCDEIGCEEDLYALEYCINSGVKLCASTHAGSIDDALERKVIKELVKRNAFDIVILLDNGENTGKIKDIRIMKDD